MLKASAHGWLSITLLLVILNTTSVCHQITGSVPANAPACLPVYFAGILCAALILPALERVSMAGGQKGIAARAGILAAPLSSTAVFLFLILLGAEEHAKVQFLIYLQVFLSGFMPPVAMRCFFRHVPVSSQAFFLGLAMGLAYGYWAMLMPLLESGTDLSNLMEQRWLSLLYAICCAAGLAFAVVIWPLLPRPEEAGETPGSKEFPEAPPAGHANWPALVILLLPLATSCAVSGLSGYQLSLRLLDHGEYPEYAPLLAALCLPISTTFVMKKGDKALRDLLVAGALLFAASPLLLAWPKSSTAYLIVHTLGAIGQQILFFTSILTCSRFAGPRGKPALALCLPWLVATVALPAAFFIRGALDAMALPPDAAIWGLSGVSALSALPLWRNFPLLLPPARKPAQEETFAPRSGATAQIPAFADAHRLSRREREILELLLRGSSTEDMAAALNLKESSIRRYVNSLLQKTGTGSRLELVAGLTSRA